MLRIAVKLIADLELFAKLEVSCHRRRLLSDDPRRRTGHQQANVNAQGREEKHRIVVLLVIQSCLNYLYSRIIVKNSLLGMRKLMVHSFSSAELE